MRPDRIPPATWLLGAAAAWAVLGALLAWAGMGGHVAAADAAGVAPQPLPRPAADAGGPAPAAFDAFAARPPFARDRRPHPFVLPGGGDEGTRGDPSLFDYVLSSVMITPQLRLAIVEPASGGEPVRVREGATADGLDGWRLVELRPRAAVFEGPGGRRELELRTWAGGGDGSLPAPPPAVEPPAPVAPPATAADKPAEPTQVAQQMDAIRRRIEARRAQLRRESQQPQAQDKSQAQPARNP